MGGGDHDANLVRLTYREHFLCHWLLTKICAGTGLRKMMRALFAMSMPANGTRIVAGWQYDVAKRAIRDLELHPDPEAERRWLERWREAKAAKVAQQKINRRRRAREKQERYAKALAKTFKGSMRVSDQDLERLSVLYLSRSNKPFEEFKSEQELKEPESSEERVRRRRRRPRPGRRARMRARAAESLAS